MGSAAAAAVTGGRERFTRGSEKKKCFSSFVIRSSSCCKRKLSVAFEGSARGLEDAGGGDQLLAISGVRFFGTAAG